MSDNIKRPRMHAYVDDDGVMVAHKNGVNVLRLSTSDLDSSDITQRWLLEGMLAAFQAGADYDDICDGSALPKREKPKAGKARGPWAHKPTKIQQAVANVRSSQLLRQARAAGGRPAADFYDADALAQAMKLSPEQLKEAARNKEVAAEMIALSVQRKPKVDLDALFSAAA